ncbi:hypothetical protein [Methylomonas sp. AM2-LC]|uniref:hypothetical protein n=1 Tax=Methylomonas sp. AM2-LC TaxID=3153301 RepID=UPI00326311DF
MSVWKHNLKEISSRDAWVVGFLNEENALRYLLVRLIATLQSLIAVTLLFLAALGGKRRFQMSS